jgi:hypothetical protein
MLSHTKIIIDLAVRAGISDCIGKGTWAENAVEPHLF